MLRIEDLWFSYRAKLILKGINLELKNSIGCLLGPNGAGKTTLLKCVAGILKPQKGSILLDGRNLLNLEFRDRARLVSYVPQEFSINFPYTALEVVLMGRNPHVNFLKGPTREDEEKALEALRLLGIERLKHKPFTSLSGGEKRLVLIARALAQESKLMVLDEPTSFLDFRNRVLVLSIVRKLSMTSSKLILLSLHDPTLACLFCDKTFLIKDGTIVSYGSPENIVTKETIEKVYGVKVKLINIDGEKVILPDVEHLNEAIEA